MKTWKIDTKEELAEAAKMALTEFNDNLSSAAVLALHGELGAGKTAFVQELGKLLGVKETITSPTFVIMKRYQTAHDSFKNLVHIDAYRLDSVDEMRVLGFKPLLGEKDTIICIEWAERIAELMPEDALHLRFSLEGEKRTLILNY